MRNLILAILVVVQLGCNKSREVKFSDIECVSVVMPEFDGKKVSLLDENGVVVKDTIIEKIEKRRTVFKPCREYIYVASFFDSERELITKTRVKMFPTGRRWELQPEIQDEVIIQYEFKSEDEVKAKSHQLNEKLPMYGWIGEVKTGVIENVEKIWMHPFRSNQFSSTEVAPFPEIKYPLAVCKSWTGNLRILKGWGDWMNSSGTFKYTIVAEEDINLRYGRISNCWKVESESDYPFGKSKLTYWFNDQLGFVKMLYQNYGGQSMEFELSEVIDA